MFLKKKLSKDDQIKKEIMDRAIIIAEEAYKKEVMFKTLTGSDMHYAIIYDLMKAAQLTGKVTLKFKDGTDIVIENTNPRDELNEQSLLY